MAWDPDNWPAPVRFGVMGWLRVVLRGISVTLVTYCGLAVLLLARLVEWPLFGARRPVTPYITQAVCRANLAILGLRYRRQGRPMDDLGAIVANHASWLDVFALNACQRIFFVAKTEVAGWPGIGWLARATGTLFIARDPRHAKAQQRLFEDRLRRGHRLLFFPEGTSTDGRRVLAFKSTLFSAFYTHGLENVMRIQPVSVIYHPPAGRDLRFYGWWGDMDFAPHLLCILAQGRQGGVDVVFHPPVSVDDFASRKDLARHCEDTVRSGLSRRLVPDGD